MIDLDFQLPLQRFTLEVTLSSTAHALAVLGPSGAGKTSLLEAIAGLRPAHGRIAVNRRTLLHTEGGVRLAPERRRLGYVPQDAVLFPHLDVRRNVRFGLGRGPGAEAAFDAAVSICEVGHLLERSPKTLSGGERQRVALARALAIGPELLLLDEPLAGADVELKERILPYLLAVRDEAKVPILYVTHNLGEARALAQEALWLRDGRVVQHGSAESVLSPGALSPPGLGSEWENVFTGSLARAEEGFVLEASPSLRLHVPWPATEVPPLPGARATFAVRAEDVLVSTQPLVGISARNRVSAKALSLEPSGADVVLRLLGGGVEWVVRLTSASVRELGLAEGQEVMLAVKTHSLRRLR